MAEAVVLAGFTRCSPGGSRCGWAGAGHAEHGSAVPADRGDGPFGLVALVAGELVQAAGDAGDQPADPADLLLRWHGFCFRPFLDIGGGEYPFPVAQQVIEIGVQVREVGHVGAEEAAARAAEPVGARRSRRP